MFPCPSSFEGGLSRWPRGGPPSREHARRLAQRTIQEPAALWARWFSRRAGLRLSGDSEWVGPLGLAIAGLPTSDRGEVWVGIRDGVPKGPGPRTLGILSLAHACTGHGDEVSRIQAAVSAGDLEDTGTDQGLRQLTEAWLGGEALPEGFEVERATEHLWTRSPDLRVVAGTDRSSDRQVREEAWSLSLARSREFGGWTRPGWDECGEEAALAVLHLMHGVLGAHPDSAFDRLELAPELPPDVKRLRVAGMRVGTSILDLEFRADPSQFDLTLSPMAGSTPLQVVLGPPGSVRRGRRGPPGWKPRGREPGARGDLVHASASNFRWTGNDGSWSEQPSASLSDAERGARP